MFKEGVAGGGRGLWADWRCGGVKAVQDGQRRESRDSLDSVAETSMSFF